MLQKAPITSDFYLLNLSKYNVVLGAYWLSTSWPIIWDFAKLIMTSKVNEREVSLQGITPLISKCVEPKYIVKGTPKPYQGFLLQICAGEKIEKIEVIHKDDFIGHLKEFLAEYEELFHEIKSFPPRR